MDYLIYLKYLSVIITILTVFCEIVETEECGQDELAACAKPLQVLTETSELSFVTKKSELDKLCPDLHAGLHCIRSYTRRCMNMNQRTHFNKLYHGTSEVIHELCEEGPYQEDFLKHAPCLRHVKSQYERCSKHYQNTVTEIANDQKAQLQQLQEQQQRHHNHHNYQQQENLLLNNTKAQEDSEEGIRAVCCAFKEYITCSEHTVLKVCGNDAATFTRSFLDKISHTLMRMHCQNFVEEPGKCGNPGLTSMATTLNQTQFSSIVIITVWTFAIFVILKIN